MEKLKKYQTQIFNVITIFLILEFAIFPGLTSANTIMNILAGVGLLLLVVWGGLVLYDYIRGYEKPNDVHEVKQTEQVSEEKPKRKSNPKQTAPKGTDESAPFVKTRKKATTKKTK